MSYYAQVREDAKDFIEEHLADFKESGEDSFYQWMSYDGKLHDYMDSAFYGYDAETICDTSDNVEEDTGLWEGLTDWRKIRDAIAFWTLRIDLWLAIAEILKDEELIPEDQIN